MEQVFQIPVKKFKKGRLEMPDEFSKLLNTKNKEELIFEDVEGSKKYVFEFEPDSNLLSGLGEWYRTSIPNVNNIIVIKCLDREKKKFRIWIEKNIAIPSGLYLGKEWNMVGARKYEYRRPFYLDLSDLLTHIFICGITGSGKTVLGKIIIEEAARIGIPSIILDVKGDLSSLAIKFKSCSTEEFLPWVEEGETAEEESSNFEEKLREFDLSKNDLKTFYDKIDVLIWTPRSGHGLQMSLTSSLSAPQDALTLYENQPEIFNNLLASLVNAFVDRLYPGTKRTKIENERNYLYEIVKYAWMHNINLEGEQGLRELLRLVDSPPFSEIGGLSVDQYINAEGRKQRLLNKINTLLSGPELSWFQGKSFKVEDALKNIDGKIPIHIINLTGLDHFEDRSFVVSHIAYEIYRWMTRQKGTKTPRLVFFIDEIGGGGGKQALFPSYPYESAAKWGLNYLLRQGRAFGICCVFATQNPGDVDYKGLSNCGVWMIGKLPTERDRKKVMEGMEVWGSGREKITQSLINAEAGDFAIKDKASKITFIRQRWLKTYHRVLTLQEVSKIMKFKK